MNDETIKRLKGKTITNVIVRKKKHGPGGIESAEFAVLADGQEVKWTETGAEAVTQVHRALVRAANPKAPLDAKPVPQAKPRPASPTLPSPSNVEAPST